MGITIKYKGLDDGPTLVTSQGRFPQGPDAQAQGPDLMSAAGLYEDSRQSQVRLELRKGQQQRVLQEVERRVADLSLRIERLNVPSSDLVLREKTALSQLPEALPMSADDQATAPAQYTVEVQWPSRGVEVFSSPQNPVEAVTLADGEHTFTMTIDGVEHELSVQVNNNGAPDAWETFRGLSEGATDTQEELLARLARAITGVDSRITAEVEYFYQDAYDDAPRSQPMNYMVRLRITSTLQDQQGPSLSFQDQDGTLVTSYGLDTGSPRRSASVRVGGQLRAQAHDAISLDNGHLSGTAQASTDGPVEVVVEQGSGIIVSELTGLVSKYNQLVSYLDSQADLLRPSLKDRITRPLEELATSLSELGFQTSKQGRLGLALNFPQRLEADFASMRQVLLDQDGWVSKLKTKLSQIMRTGVEAFAAELDVKRSLSDRQRMWAMLRDISNGIINGYY